VGFPEAHALEPYLSPNSRGLKNLARIPYRSCFGAPPFFAKPEVRAVRFQVQTIEHRPLPSVTRVRPGAHSARHQDFRNDLTPCRMAWHLISDGAHPPHSGQTLGPSPTQRAPHSAQRLPSLASLCPSLVRISGRGVCLGVDLTSCLEINEPPRGNPGQRAGVKTLR